MEEDSQSISVIDLQPLIFWMGNFGPKEIDFQLTRELMSALGQKQTYAVQKSMSALPPKADMCGATSDVRFGPKADIALFIRWAIKPGERRGPCIGS